MSRNARFAIKILRRHAIFASAWLLLSGGAHRALAAPDTPSTPPAIPRVVSVHHPDATEAFRPDPAITRTMLDCALTNLLGAGTVTQAWASLVSTQDVVGLKVFSVPGPNSGTRPAVVAAVVEGLLAAGVSNRNIIIWDRHAGDLRAAGFFNLAERYHVRAAGADQAGYDAGVFYERPLIGSLVWGDLEFGKEGPGIGRKSFVTRIVTKQVTKIITISPLLNHNLTGVTGHLMSLALGSVDNILRFENDLEVLVQAIPEIYALEAVGDKVVLNITDGLICQYEGNERSLLHYADPANQLWASRDPLALDLMALRELDQRRITNANPRLKHRRELYSNAALLQLGSDDLRQVQVDKIELGR